MDVKQAMAIWTDVLVNGQSHKPTEAVLYELSDYSGLSLEEVKRLSTTSTATTAQKWVEADRATPEGLQAFYDSISNWVFGTLSYHARQAEGENIPLPVQAAAVVGDVKPAVMLDFGCGVATACLLFSRLGWSVDGADISKPLLEFARWRFSKRNLAGRIIDLNVESLPPTTYDVITAFNTMAHVRELDTTLQKLHASLRPGGRFIFDIDSRERRHGNEWHLYEYDGQVLRAMRRNGFVRVPAPSLYVYERRDMTAAGRTWWRLFDQIRYNRLTIEASKLRRRLRAQR